MSTIDRPGTPQVETIFSTEQVHPRDRFDYWHSVACKTLVDHSSRPKSRSGFEAEMQTGLLGNLEIVLFQNSPMQVLHTALQAARSKSNELFVCRQMAGTAFIQQDTRGVTMEVGDVTLVDPLLPYDARFGADSKFLVTKVARWELEARFGKIRGATARLIKPVGVENTLTSSALSMLPSLAGSMNSLTGEVVGNHALDLLAISLSKTMQRSVRVRVSDCKAVVLSSVWAAVEARLADPQLDAASVAGAAGFSVRYVNAVLAEQDTSIMRLIQARRLARCRYALEDPNQAHRRVSEIAYGWGFTDMTHFGRRFKKAYGILPSEYRTLAKNRGSNE
jgi:AraC family transcriptional activator of tynA and feaB